MLNHIYSTFLFQAPDELEDILSLNEIEETYGEDVANKIFHNLKDINSLIVYDEEMETAQILSDSHSYNILSLSCRIIADALPEHPEYIRKVVEIFHIELFLDVPEEHKPLDVA